MAGEQRSLRELARIESDDRRMTYDQYFKLYGPEGLPREQPVHASGVRGRERSRSSSIDFEVAMQMKEMEADLELPLPTQKTVRVKQECEEDDLPPALSHRIVRGSGMSRAEHITSIRRRTKWIMKFYVDKHGLNRCQWDDILRTIIFLYAQRDCYCTRELHDDVKTHARLLLDLPGKP